MSAEEGTGDQRQMAVRGHEGGSGRDLVSSSLQNLGPPISYRMECVERKVQSKLLVEEVSGKGENWFRV